MRLTLKLYQSEVHMYVCIVFLLQKKDLLQVMIDTKDEQNKKGLSTGEIVADAVGFLFAGHETTSVTLTFATYLLATHPEVQEKLVNEIHDYFQDNPVCFTMTLYRLGNSMCTTCTRSYEGLSSIFIMHTSGNIEDCE